MDFAGPARPASLLMRKVSEMRYWALVATLMILALLVVGGSCDKIGQPNLPPRTFFQPGGAPPETLVIDNFQFRWFGSDTDSDIQTYYWRIGLASMPCDSLTDSMAMDMMETLPWNNTEDPRVFVSFADVQTTPDGPYVFQARTVDEFGATDEVPLTDCFSVFIQQAPTCSLTEVPTPRLAQPEANYKFTAKKFTRQGGEVEDVNFEYSWQFSRIDPGPQEIMFFWSNWIPMTGDPPEGTANVSGLQAHFKYLFQLKVRDAGFTEIESEQCRHEFEN